LKPAVALKAAGPKWGRRAANLNRRHAQASASYWRTVRTAVIDALQQALPDA
jgi:hypothetical protein